MFLFILINLKLLSFLAIHQKEENTVYCIFSKLNVKFHNRATFYQKKMTKKSMHAEKKSTFTNNLNGLKELPEYVLKVLIEKKILLFEKSDHFYLSLKQNWFKEM